MLKPSMTKPTSVSNSKKKKKIKNDSITCAKIDSLLALMRRVKEIKPIK